MTSFTEAGAERSRRWRLILGAEADGLGCGLGGEDRRMDAALAALYGGAPEGEGGRDGDRDGPRRGGLGDSAPRVARWLGDIREFFPAGVVRVMQRDALEKFDLRRLLLEPEMMEAVEPDVHLAADLIALSHLMPERAKATARQVVAKVVEALLARLRLPLEQAVRGSLNRARRNYRPRHAEIDWLRTIRANLQHYQPTYHTVIPERLIGYARKRPRRMQDIILCVDQSGSMAGSVVYAGVFASVLASLPALSTRLVVFDTNVADLSDKLHDPVEVLFGTQLGGGTDINQALRYAEQQLREPCRTVLILITDLFEGGDPRALLRRVARLKQAGTRLITLLALNDDGAPAHDHHLAGQFAGLDIPCFASTPDQFPDLMAALLEGRDLAEWAAQRDIVLTRGQATPDSA